ncbi:ATP-binding cassette domain-containing protein [Paracidovorax citrulli]
MLEARGLDVAFGGIHAVRQVDMRIGPAELICIIGPNGAGKSTLLGVLSGAVRTHAGSLAISGRDMTRQLPHEFARRGVIRKFQGTNVFQWLSVRENLVVAAQGVEGDRARSAPDCDEILALTGLQHRADETAECLPHGERQWLEIGMALMCRPRLLLLDEPAAGMSVDGTRRMVGMLRQLSQEMSVVVIEHDIGFVRELACRTLVMHQGAVIRQGAFAEIERDEHIRHIYLGRSKEARHAGRA